MRRTELATGTVLQEHLLPADEWGEGLTLLDDTCAAAVALLMQYESAPLSDRACCSCIGLLCECLS